MGDNALKHFRPHDSLIDRNPDLTAKMAVFHTLFSGRFLFLGGFHFFHITHHFFQST